MRPLLPALLAALLAMPAFLPADDFKLALDEAKGKIFRYRMAKNSGDPMALREATMRLQEDPLAIRRVNSQSTEAFKIELNKDIGAVQQQTRELIKTRFAERGISPERVTFFEATNPIKPGEKVKVGQDWDVTVRVDGRDVPTRISQPIAHEAYYEVGTGRKPPPVTATDPVSREARKSYRRAANHYAEQQSLAVTDYQYREAYGGNSAEGSRIISGPKDVPLRDPVQMSKVIEYKSIEARNLAEQLRKEGKLGAAVGREIEQMRQSTKQYDKQVKVRVEAMGGRVPDHIVKGQEIMKQIDAGRVTPAQAAQQLREMGESPTSIIRKSAELLEAAQVLKPPGKSGPPAPDVFVENVQDRLANKRLNRVLEQVDSGKLTVEQARQQIEKIAPNPKVAPVEGVGSITRRQANNALGLLWMTSTVVNASAEEGLAAAEAGEDPSVLRAMGRAILEATMIPGMIEGIKHGNNIGEEELAKADAEGRSELDATLSGFSRFGQELSGWTLGSQIAQEEIIDEEARAEAEGREPSYFNSTLNGAVRGLGEVLMINTIANAANSLTEEEVIQRGQEQVLRAWVQGKLLEDLRALAGIQRDLEEFMLTTNVRAPDFATQLAELTDRYESARLAMANLSDAAARQLGAQDPLALTVRDRTGALPDPPAAADIIAAREADLTPVPNVVGQSLMTASSTITDAQLTPQAAKATRVPANIKPLVVFGQDPKAGERVEPDTAVTLIYNPGGNVAMSLQVPDVTKLTKAEAEAKLTDMKFKFKAEAGDKKPARTNKNQEVYAQSPQAETEAGEGDTVSFTYYAGIPVGRYIGMSKDAAAKAITDAELRPKIEEGGNITQNEAERFNIYAQSPQPGEHVWFDDEVSAQYYKLVEGGFQPNDWEKVDAARLAAAKVYDAGDPALDMFKGASGKHCAIYLPAPRTANLQTASQMWIIVKFADAGGAKAVYDQMIGPMTANQNIAGHTEKLVREDGGVAYTRNMNLGGYRLTNHIRGAIYRDIFLIFYSMHEPQAAADTSHGAQIMQKSKDLINLRFPKP